MTDQLTPWTICAPPSGEEIARWSPRRLGEMAAIRRAIADLLTTPDHQVDEEGVADVLLVVDELLSNGLRHGTPPITLRLHREPPSYLVRVEDHAHDRPPAPTADRDPALGGMGLGMVARVAAATGWCTTGDGKDVWARITIQQT